MPSTEENICETEDCDNVLSVNEFGHLCWTQANTLSYGNCESTLYCNCCIDCRQTCLDGFMDDEKAGNIPSPCDSNGLLYKE
ncbi:hypothetical protein COB64_01790 [Candidatus Wolfebacteria bacterium]|nr:MAG: hypothetical protein COB64_01790 [Candidatus Wolfebacteria bacterium]